MVRTNGIVPIGTSISGEVEAIIYDDKCNGTSETYKKYLSIDLENDFTSQPDLFISGGMADWISGNIEQAKD